MPETMKAAVLKAPRQLTVEEVPVPAPEPSEVLVKVAACGICGSDLRYFVGENPWAMHTLGREAPNPPNIILGHEFGGEVVAAGDGRFEELVGQRIVVSAYAACGMCVECRLGQYNLCKATIHLGHGAGWGDREYYPGGMAEYCAVWADKAYPLPDSVSWEEATFLDIAGVGIHAVRVSEMKPDGVVVVLGAGPLGLSIAQVAKAWGARATCCTDVYPKALAVAAEVGVDRAIDATTDDPKEAVLDATDGRGADYVFDTAGTAETQRQAIEMLAPSGALINLVTNRTKVSFELLELAAERSIRTSTNYFFHDFQTAIDMAGSGQLALAPMITHRFPLADANRAFDAGLNKDEHEALKIVITMGRDR